MSNGIWLKDDGPKSVAGHFVCPLTQKKKNTGNGQLLFVCLSVYVCVFLCACVCLYVCMGVCCPRAFTGHGMKNRGLVTSLSVSFGLWNRLHDSSTYNIPPFAFPSLPFPRSLYRLLFPSLSDIPCSHLACCCCCCFFFPRFCYVRHLWAYLNIWASLPAMSIKRETHSDRIAGERRECPDCTRWIHGRHYNFEIHSRISNLVLELGSSGK